MCDSLFDFDNDSVLSTEEEIIDTGLLLDLLDDEESGNEDEDE